MNDVKYYTENQIHLFRMTAKTMADQGACQENSNAIKEWAVIDFITMTGAKVSEVTNVRCGDIRCENGQPAIHIRGNKSRTIKMPESLATHLNSFLNWKESRGESISGNSHLFIGQRGPMGSQAIQGIIKKYLKMLGIYEHGKSVHALRHTFAIELYRREKDIHNLKKQLGHRSVQTTIIYADLLDKEKEEQVKQSKN